MKQISLIFVILFILFGCASQKDASEVVVYLSTSSTVAGSGDYVIVGIDARTINENLEELSLSSFDALNGNLVLDTYEISGTRYQDDYLYKAPEFVNRDSLPVTLSVEARDNLGYSRRSKVNLLVYASDALLSDAATSVAIYSPYAGENRTDGFCISELLPLVTSVAETSSIDIYVPAVGAEGSEETMPLEWRSRTGIKFAKMSGIDYSSLTRNSLRAIWSSAMKLDLAQNLAPDDVILVGTESNAMAAILITAVYDEPASLNDRILFNIKVL